MPCSYVSSHCFHYSLALVWSTRYWTSFWNEVLVDPYSWVLENITWTYRRNIDVSEPWPSTWLQRSLALFYNIPQTYGPDSAGLSVGCCVQWRLFTQETILHPTSRCMLRMPNIEVLNRTLMRIQPVAFHFLEADVAIGEPEACLCFPNESGSLNSKRTCQFKMLQTQEFYQRCISDGSA